MVAWVDCPPLDGSYGWRGAVYRAGTTRIPQDLAIAMGITAAPAPPPNVDPGIQNENENEPDPPALILINEATEANDLTPLPGVGPAAAGHIFENRPDGGYESLEQLPTLVPQVFVPPFSVSVEVLVAWEGS